MDIKELRKIAACGEDSRNQFKAILPRGTATPTKANAQGVRASGTASGSPEKLGERRRRIVEIMLENPSVTTMELVDNLGVSQTAIEKNLAWLKAHGLIRRKGGDRGGHWEVVAH